MPASRARSKSNGPQPSLAPVIVLGGFAAAAAACAFRFPGIAAIWIAFIVAAFMEPQVALTGPKKGGYPTAANPAESAKMERFRLWHDLRFRMLLPNKDWFPGWPVQVSWLFAACAAGVAATLLPVRLPIFMAINAAAALIVVAQMSAAVRRRAGEDCPGTTLASFGALVRSQYAIFIAVGAVVLAAAADVAVVMFVPAHLLPHRMLALIPLTVLGLLAAAAGPWKSIALEEWRALVNSRAEWTPRWEALKLDPAPRLIGHRTLGPLRIDSFEAPSHTGASAYWPMAPKVAPFVGPGMRVAVLEVPDEGPMGPVAGTRHPLKFDVVTVASHELPDLADGSLDPELVQMYAHCCFVWATESRGFGRPVPIGVERITVEIAPSDEGADSLAAPTGAPKIDMNKDSSAPSPYGSPDAAPGEINPDDEINPETGLRMSVGKKPEKKKRKKRGTPEPTAPSGPAAYSSSWAWPGGPDLGTIRTSIGSEPVAETFGTDILIDSRNDAVYFGFLSGEDSDYIEGAAVTDRLNQLQEEDRWAAIWKAVLKQGVNPPTMHHGTVSTLPLSDGTDVTRLGFAVRLGEDPKSYQRLEPRIATALNGAAFVGVTGWPAPNERLGTRHSVAFGLVMSKTPVPQAPDLLDESPAAMWVLAGRINEMFDACKVPRPEVADATCLTGPSRRAPRGESGRAQGAARRIVKRPGVGNIWEVRLRLHDGVTLSHVRSSAERLRQAIGTPWLRVAEAEDGCVLFMGATPDTAALSNPDLDGPRLQSLDWEQAWLDAKIIGQGGQLPRLISVAPMPNNPAVNTIVFDLPSGLDIVEIRSATAKLRTSTGNEYIDIRQSKESPSRITVQCCQTNPMPGLVPYPFDRTPTLGKVGFATGIDGDDIVWTPKSDPHILFMGSSGPQPLDANVPVPASEKFPSGWATIGDLAEGDEVLTANGAVTRITDMHPVQNLTTFTVHLSDGQSVRCGPDHLWKASKATSRAVHATRTTSTRDAFVDKKLALAAKLREQANAVPLGTWATLNQIVAAYGHQPVRKFTPKAISVPGLVPGRSARLYRVDDVITAISGDMGTAMIVAGIEFEKPAIVMELSRAGGQWLSLREVSDIALGRPSTRTERGIIKFWVRDADFKDSTGVMAADIYPVDEVLRLYADAVENGTERFGVRQLEAIVSASEMAKSLVAPNRGSNWAIRVPAPVELPEADLPIAPYVLGAWLGDGTSLSGCITQGSSDSCTDANGLSDRDFLCAEIVAEGVDAKSSLVEPTIIRTVGLNTALKIMGVRGNKHIPAIYLRASIGQRLALLQGLMDTDGTIDANGCCELSFCDERLATGALELIRSLGIKCAMTSSPASITEADPDNPGMKRRRVTSTRYRMHFTTTTPVFRLPRKAARIPVEVRGTQDWLYVVGIDVDGPDVPMRCISVADTEHLYLTEGFVPTHNSGKSAAAQAVLVGALLAGSELIIIDPTKGASDFAFLKPYARRIVGLDPDKDQVFHILDAAATFKAVYAEGGRRRNLNSRHGVGNYLDLPEDVRPPHVVVFVDEYIGLVMPQSGIPRQPFDDEEMEFDRQMAVAMNNARQQIGNATAKLAAEARAWGISLIIGTQQITADALKKAGAEGLKVNMARMLLGKSNPGNRMSALRVPEEYPDMGDAIGKGRGVWEPMDSSMEMIQVWYASQREYLAALQERIEPLAEAEMLDPSQYMTTMPTLQNQGGFDDDDFGANSAPSVAAEEVVETTTIELSLDDLEISLDDLEDALVDPAPAPSRDEELPPYEPESPPEAPAPEAESAPEMEPVPDEPEDFDRFVPDDDGEEDDEPEMPLGLPSTPNGAASTASEPTLVAALPSAPEPALVAPATELAAAGWDDLDDLFGSQIDTAAPGTTQEVPSPAAVTEQPAPSAQAAEPPPVDAALDWSNDGIDFGEPEPLAAEPEQVSPALISPVETAVPEAAVPVETAPAAVPDPEPEPAAPPVVQEPVTQKSAPAPVDPFDSFGTPSAATSKRRRDTSEDPFA